MIRHPGLFLGICVILLAAGGASCPFSRQPVAPPMPVIFAGRASLQEVIQAVNNNTQAVHQLQTGSGTVSVQGMPGLRANLALERPRRFRLRADLVNFPQVDLGSNDELFWIWAKPIQPPGVYWARHEQFHYTAARDLLGIEPEWLIDALGLVQLDPAGQHEGPYAAGAGRMQIISRLVGGTGEPLTRVLVLHDTYGWVLEQHLFDARNQLMASAIASEHRYYPAERVSLPHRIRITLGSPNATSANMGFPREFELEVSSYTINRLSADPSTLFALPQLENYPHVNLANLHLQMPPAAHRQIVPRTGYRPAETDHRPNLRGLSR